MLNKVFKRLRLNKELTQAYLSQRLDIKPSHLCEIEKGKANPSLSLINSYSLYFGYPVWALFAARDVLASNDKQAREAIANACPRLLEVISDE